MVAVKTSVNKDKLDCGFKEGLMRCEVTINGKRSIIDSPEQVFFEKLDIFATPRGIRLSEGNNFVKCNVANKFISCKSIMEDE